jgi:hypothetical protein
MISSLTLAVMHPNKQPASASNAEYFPDQA